MVSFNIENLNSGANPTLQILLIKFGVARATLNHILEMAALKGGLNKTGMGKVG